MNAAQMLPDLKRMSCSGESLSDFIDSYFDPAHLRDACTRKHIIVNSQMASRNGFESIHDLIGMTAQELWIQDIVQRRDRFNIDPVVISNEIKNVEKIENLEKQSIFNRRPISINRSTLDFNGIIHFERLLKVPILSQEKKVVALLTVFQDLTYHYIAQSYFNFIKDSIPQRKPSKRLWNILN
jgi:hypothetical protein